VAISLTLPVGTPGRCFLFRLEVCVEFRSRRNPRTSRAAVPRRHRRACHWYRHRRRHYGVAGECGADGTGLRVLAGWGWAVRYRLKGIPKAAPTMDIGNSNITEDKAFFELKHPGFRAVLEVSEDAESDDELEWGEPGAVCEFCDVPVIDISPTWRMMEDDGGWVCGECVASHEAQR